MEQRSMKARRALHGLRGYVAQLTWEGDIAEGKRLLKELERLVDCAALRPGNAREPEAADAAKVFFGAGAPRIADEYSRQDKIRDELANDPHCYD